MPESFKTIAENRKARHDYFVLEALETGIELVGTEVKSIRTGSVNLKDSWVDVINGDLMVMACISAHTKRVIFLTVTPVRPRRLLAHGREIRRLAAEVKQNGLTLVPLRLYFKGSRVKVQVGLCKGKKLYDKRATTAQRDAKRDIDRAMKTQNKA